jgi:hypothetical protein
MEALVDQRRHEADGDGHHEHGEAALHNEHPLLLLQLDRHVASHGPVVLQSSVTPGRSGDRSAPARPPYGFRGRCASPAAAGAEPAGHEQHRQVAEHLQVEAGIADRGRAGLHQLWEQRDALEQGADEAAKDWVAKNVDACGVKDFPEPTAPPPAARSRRSGTTELVGYYSLRAGAAPPGDDAGVWWCTLARPRVTPSDRSALPSSPSRRPAQLPGETVS